MNIFDAHISGSLSVSSSAQISGDLTVLGTINATISGTTTNALTASEAPKYTLTSSFGSFTSSYTTGSFTGSFKGDGTNLYNIPASGVTGLNLNKIISGSVSASISPNRGFEVNTDATFTGSVNITGSIYLNGNPIGTGKLDETTFNSYTSSITISDNNQNTRLGLLETSTGSLNTFTSSTSGRLTSLENTSGSINTFTSSASGRLTSLENTSGSINTFTSSALTRVSTIESTTSSLNTFTSSASGRLTSIEGKTGSITSLNTFTSSLSGAVEVTGSNLTVKGNLLVKGTTTQIDSTTLNIGDNIIQLNGSGTSNAGLVVQDASGASIVSGSLLWDTAADYWKAGKLGSEDRIILATEFTTASSSLNSRALSLENASALIRGDFNTYTGSNDSTNTTQNSRLTSIEGKSGSISLLNTYTGSNNTVIGTLQTSTGSLNTFTSSASGRLTSLESASGSIRTDFNSFTSSNNTVESTQNSRLTSIEGVTGSIGLLNTYTGSNNTVIGTLQTATSSINTFTSSALTRVTAIETSTGSLNTFTSSASGRLTSIEGVTGSVSSLNTYTGSNNTVIGTLQTSTGSLNTFTSSASGRLISIEGVTGSISSLNTYTGSNNTTNTTQNNRLDSIEGKTGSITLLNTYTGSNDTTNTTQNSRLTSIEGVTGSVSSLNTYTGSNNTVIGTLQTSTSSLNSFTSSASGRLTSLESASSSIRGDFNTYTSSNNSTNTTQNSRLTSIESTTSSLNSFTSSIDTTIKNKLNTETVISGSVQVLITGTTGYSTFSSSISTSIGSLSSSVATTTSGLSSSINSLSSSVATTTSGLSSSIGSLNTFTSSIDTTIKNKLNTETVISGSVQVLITGTTGYSSFSSSISTSLGLLSSSVATTTSGLSSSLSSSIGSLSSSVATTTLGLSSSIGSLSSSIATTTLGLSSSIGSLSSSIATTNSNQDGKLTSLESYTGSNNTVIGTLQTSTSSLNTYTSSNTTNINAIHTSTGSFKSFTSSFDTAFGMSGADVTVKGNFTVSGTSTTVNSTTVAIGDNIIQLNGTGATNAGLVVRDATAPNTVSGSLLWDSTNDNWVAGALGSEQRLVRETEFNNAVTRIGNVETSTGSLNSFTSSINTTIKSKLNTEGVLSGSIQVNHNATTNYVANQHIDHTAVSITAGSGLSGGGDISATRTVSLDTGSVHFLDGVKKELNTEGVISGSSQVVAALPSGTVSGSAQVTLSSTTGYGSVLNQAVLTTSTPTFAVLTITSNTDGKLTLRVPSSGDTNDWNYINFVGANGTRDMYFGTDSTGNPSWYRDDNGLNIGLGSVATVNGVQIVTNSGTWGISITGNANTATTATEVVRTVGAGSEANLLSAIIGDNDHFRLRVGGSSNSGFAEIATADDGTEPIYVRQYTGAFSSLTRTATLLDGSGNTSFPGTLSASNYSGTHSGTSSGTNTGDQTNISGNATTASTAAALYGSTGLVTQFGNGTLGFVYAVTNPQTGLFTAVDNSNAIITINRHPGDYYSQLGFSSNGNLYYRSFSATAINTSQAWQTIWTSSSLTNLNQLSNGPAYITGITSGNVTTALGFTPYNATNPSGFISSITSGNVTTALGFTPYNATNPNGYTTNTGTVTSVSGTGTVSGLSLSGTVTTSGNLTLGGTLTLTSGNVTTALGFTPISSYTETDTLASVTGRGNTTTSSMAIGAGSIPNGKLYVNSGSGSDVVALQNSLNTGAYLVFADGVTPTWTNAPRLGAISNDMVFKTLNVERFRILSTGPATFTSTISASNLSGTNTGDQTLPTLSSLGGQPQLNGTGFVKVVGTTVSYDNSTYLTSITSGNVTTALGFTPYNATNPSGYISSITSGNVTTALGYTPYNATNPNGYITGISFANVSSKPTTLSGYGITDSIKSNGTLTGNIDSDWGESFTTFDPVPSGTPPLSSPNIRTVNIGNNFARRTQLAFDYASDVAYFRRRNDSGWQTWREFIHSGNIGSQTVATAGALSSMNISQFTNNSGYLTSITSGNVTTALGFTPYNATNPSGYITGISFANVSSKPTTISGYGITDAITTGNIGSQTVSTSTYASYLNALTSYGWTSAALPQTYHLGITSAFVGPAAGEGSWQNYGSVMTMRTYSGGGGSLQLYTPYGPSNGGDSLQVRFGNYNISVGNSWTSWKTLIDSGNIGSQTVATAGALTSMNISQFTNNSAYLTGITSGNVTTALGYTPYNATNPSGYISSYSETSTLANVTTRGATTTNNITIGAITVGGSLSYGTYTGVSNYVTGADNILLKGNSSGVSGIFFESEKDGTNINHPSDFAFIQFHSYGIGGSSGEANRLVIGTSNDADDMIVLNPVASDGVKVRVGAGTTDYTVFHSGNLTNLNQLSNGPAYISSITSGNVTTALGFTPYNATNPNGYITGISFANVSSKPTTISGYGITDAITTGNIGSQSVSSAGYATYLTTNYAGGQQTNPQVYFNQGYGVKVAMTGAWNVWSDTLWINGYAGGDVLQMCALHTMRNGTPRMAISVQASNSSSYGTFYEFITSYNIASQSVSYATTAGSLSSMNVSQFTNNSGYATLSGSNSFSNSYNEFGDGVGSVSNDGGWHGRLNVAGSQHARIDVVSVSDGIITTMFSHIGQGVGRVGTYSNHPLSLMVNGTGRVSIDTSGHLLPNSNNAHNLGSASFGWANVYTNDLHLSNMSKPEGNDIDGTNGTWTIQEGSENLYIINNNNGEKFKIVLEKI